MATPAERIATPVAGARVLARSAALAAWIAFGAAMAGCAGSGGGSLLPAGTAPGAAAVSSPAPAVASPTSQAAPTSVPGAQVPTAVPASALPAASPSDQPATAIPGGSPAATAPNVPATPAGPATPFAGPSLLAVTCDGTTTRLNATAVRAASDGVHVQALSVGGEPADVDVSTEDRGTVASAHGSTNLVIPPGAYQLACVDAAAGTGPGVAVVVADPDGLWKSADLTCGDSSGTTSSLDLPPAPPSVAIAYVRTIIRLAPGDVLEPAGYSLAPSGRIRLVRGGQVVASWSILLGDHGAPTVGSSERCAAPLGPEPLK